MTQYNFREKYEALLLSSSNEVKELRHEAQKAAQVRVLPFIPFEAQRHPNLTVRCLAAPSRLENVPEIAVPF